MKPGIKTTEFWLTLGATVAGLVLATVAKEMPPQWGAMVAALSVVAYNYSRGQAKGR